MTRYRAGVIGHTGRGNYGHSLDTVYLGMDEIDLVAVADADADGLAAAGERLGVGREGCYRDYRQMLEQEELDIVSVAPRWMDQKHDMVIAAAEAGVRGIFCEKPFAPTLAEADAMIAACDRAGTKVAVSHQGRVGQVAHRLKEMIADGVIGEVKEVYSGGKQDQPRRRPGSDGAGNAFARHALLSVWPSTLGAGVCLAGWKGRRTGARSPGPRRDRAHPGQPSGSHLCIRPGHYGDFPLAPAARCGRDLGRAGSRSTGQRGYFSTVTATCSTAPIPIRTRPCPNRPGR